MKRILIIEDEKELAFIIGRSLKEAGFQTLHTYDGNKALEMFCEYSPDLVLLDINLPNKNGWEICKEIREISKKPIIIMTARDTELDEIQGLELGADDYVTKPFSDKLILIKIKKMLGLENKEIFVMGALTFDPETFKIIVDEEEENLPKREAAALELFFKNKGKVLSREFLLNEVWGFNFSGDERAVDTLIKRLRKKLGTCSEIIKSVRGVGYVLEEEKL